MSTTQVPANVAPRTPTQAQVDQTGESLKQAAQAAADKQTAAENQRRAEAAKATQQRKQEAIQAAKRQQQAKVQAEREDIRVGDHVVIDLAKVPEALHTVSMREHLRRLHQGGAHLEAGRVAAINDTPTGREVVVETSVANHTVPIGAVTRADLFDEASLKDSPSFQ